GSAPLSEPESGLAIKILDLLARTPSDLGAEPGYAIITGLLFYLLGPENSLARLAPALLGGVVVCLPYFYRTILGRKAALLLALGLALDPGLVALSRQASGAMIGVSFLLLALTAGLAGRPVLTGAFIGLSLISGPVGVLGFLGMGLAVLIGRFAKISLPEPEPTHEDVSESRWSPVQLGLLSMGGTLLLVGTLFMVYPSGLGAIAGVIPGTINRLVTSAGISVGWQGFALLIYQPLVVVFGLIGGILAWARRDDLGRFLTIWFLIALLLAVIPPGRQVWFLAWPLIPLLALAAKTLGPEFVWDRETRLVSAGLAALIVILLAFIWLQFASIARVEQASQTRILLILGIFLITGVSTGLIAFGWSWEVARRGLVWGLFLAVGLYSLSLSMRMLSPDAPRAQELWYGQPTVVEEELLLKSLGDISEWSTGRRESVDISVTHDLPSLRWALRKYPMATFGAQPGSGSMPSTLITTLFEEPSQAAAYRGADYLWLSALAWEGAAPPDILRWMVFRESPTRNEHIIFWARNDLFPGGLIDPAADLPLEPDPEQVP
ncbi:MAG: hypothetical protein R3335_13420, partial [Anaerolineales bacterium]|nr:hypothetical protein [Anaerolineales bacterium]